MHQKSNNKYLWLRFGLANAINNYLRLKNRLVYVHIFSLKCGKLNLSNQIWVRFIFVYQKSLIRTFKIGFWIWNLLNLCSSAVNSHRLFCSKKSKCKMFILKLSGKKLFLRHPYFCLKPLLWKSWCRLIEKTIFTSLKNVS